MKRTPEEIYAALVTAGFSADAATTMTATALGESGGDDAALGDLTLQDGEWGPSYGLFQIRTLKGATGSGSVRDISALAGSVAAQARAAFEISSHGSDFTPWTVYTSGRWKDYLGSVSDLAKTGIPGIPAPSQLLGGLPSSISSLLSAAMSNLRSLGVEISIVMLGLALAGAGAAVAVRKAR